MRKNEIKKITVSVVFSLFLLCNAFNGVAEEEEKKEAGVKETESKGSGIQQNKPDSLMERIDFGNSYILGQSIKSGAVYLLHRKKSDIKSMLKTREDYRKEILEDFKVNEEKDDK